MNLMPHVVIKIPSRSPRGGSKCASANCDFKHVFLMAGFLHFPHICLVAMATPALMLSIARVLASLYSMGRVMFPSSPSQYSPTLFKGIDVFGYFL